MPSSASVRAEPTWARITTRPRSLRATCTATAPEAVRTFRTYATARTYPFSTPNHLSRPENLHVKTPHTKNCANHVQTQVIRCGLGGPTLGIMNTTYNTKKKRLIAALAVAAAVA